MSEIERMAQEIVSVSDDAVLESVSDGMFVVSFSGDRVPFELLEYARGFSFKVDEIKHSDLSVSVVFGKHAEYWPPTHGDTDREGK